MKHRMLGVVLTVVLGASAVAAATDPQIVAPLHKFADRFNKGDVAGAAATHAATDDLTIVDEVPPYAWHGPQAFSTWASALESHDKANGITDEKVTIGDATRVESDGQQAYVIVPAVYEFKQHGKAMHEKAQMTFVLKKDPGGWMIHGWTWTGPKARPATPAKP